MHLDDFFFEQQIPEFFENEISVDPESPALELPFLPCFAKSIFDSIDSLEFKEESSKNIEFFSEKAMWFCWVSK